MLAPGRLCFWSPGFRANMCFHRDVGDLGPVQVPTCTSRSIMFQDAMMSAQVFKTCPSSEMPWERWSDWNYEVQKKFYPLQACHDRLSSRRLHLFARHPPTAPWANLWSWRGVDRKLSTFSFTHLSTNCLTQTPQMLKKNPLSLSSLAPSSSASDGQFLQRARLVLTTW